MFLLIINYYFTTLLILIEYNFYINQAIYPDIFTAF